MSRRFKTLWSPCLAALALLVVTAPAAQAEPLFEADSYPATVVGVTAPEFVSVWTFGGEYKFTCGTDQFSGELTEPSETLALATLSEECLWVWPPTEPPPPPSIVEVKMNSCVERLGAVFFDEESGRDLAPLALECPEGNQVEIVLYEKSLELCKLTVPSQTSVEHVWLENQENEKGSADDTVVGKFTFEGLHYSQDKLFCPVKTGTYEDLSYVAINVFSAANESEEQIGLRIGE